ncbi:hypothetical protein B0A48_05985 [Cryoendolithus antarcticus]|uniref:ABC transporter n=1 Tax=Cryoendolithus antarcticus TaxID=1507870 RepID=A0A1V8TCS7_9PEZI|nr:hypothetical protein B0A48_05985 [Cryoendolithus antarcticus]
MQCYTKDDDLFGPQVQGCRSGFDFTLLFEQSVFQIAPCALLLVSIPVRAAYLRRQNVKTLKTSMATAKLAAIALLAVTQLALLIVWAVTPVLPTRASIPAATLSFLASLALLFLSSIEHSRSVRPSAVINLYLFGSLILDIPQARTLWLRSGPRSLPGVFTAGVAAKTVSLLLEARSKRRSLFQPYRLLAPEALVSLYDQAVLWWLIPLFKSGFRGIISIESLYPVDTSLSSDDVDQRSQRVWNTRVALDKTSLLWTLLQQVNTDIQRITTSMAMIDNLFAAPAEVAVAVFLLNRQTGVSCIAPIALSLLISGISFATSTVAIPYQKKWLKAVSERVSYTAAVLGFPKGFKMLGLTEHLSAEIQALRVKELDDYASFRKFSVWRNVFGGLPELFSGPVALMMYTQINGTSALTQTRAFTTLSLLNLLAAPVEQLIHVIPQVQTALASVQRIEAFLLQRSATSLLLTKDALSHMGHSGVDHDDVAHDGNAIELSVLAKQSDTQDRKAHVTLADVTIRLGDKQRHILRNIDLKLAADSLTVVTGPVGSGKSTLLRTILGELPITSGRRTIASGSVEFAYCAQTPWLPNGSVKDLIISCSQPDEVFLDAVVHACALDKDVNSFPQGVGTMIGTKGLSLSGGQRQRLALARAVFSRKSCILVDDALSGLDATTSRHVFDRLFGQHGLCKLHGMTVILTSHAPIVASQADHIVALNSSGHIAKQGSFEELLHTPGYISELIADSKDVESSRAVEDVKADFSRPAAGAGAEPSDLQQDLARRTGDTAVYGYYARSIGWYYSIILIVTVLLYAVPFIFSSVWVSWWAADATGMGPIALPLWAWLAIYFAFPTVASVSVGYHIWVFLVDVVPRSSGRLHQQLLHAVMNAPYSMFVETDTGVILNRFSNDMTLIELDLVGAVLQTISGVVFAIGSSILIVLGSKYAAAMMPLLIGAVYILQKVYLRTSRQMRFMDLEALAPLMTHVQETVAGVATIRAYGWARNFHTKCKELLDSSQRAFYLMLCIQRWLGLVLDLLTAAVATVVVALAMELRDSASSASIGISLLQILSFNFYLTGLINAWTNLETSLGAVARIKNFEATTRSEHLPEESRQTDQQWPAKGQLTISNLSARYSPSGDNVIHDIALSIPAGSKVGVCGRSGSGKSSLLLTILRLLDTPTGSIMVDGADLATLPRQTVRSRIAALPQESILIPGTIRANLDPLGSATDAELESALANAGILGSISLAGGLGSSMSALALSHGQMQLFAVARTLLRPSKLLVLDEMTSSVDAATEMKVMDVIHEGFEGSTIIAVAHRLQTIVGYDMIVVMDAGRIVEVGKPRELLKKEGGSFREMWERSGH